MYKIRNFGSTINGVGKEYHLSRFNDIKLLLDIHDSERNLRRLLLAGGKRSIGFRSQVCRKAVTCACKREIILHEEINSYKAVDQT